jgi:hypothetical protein
MPLCTTNWRSTRISYDSKPSYPNPNPQPLPAATIIRPACIHITGHSAYSLCSATHSMIWQRSHL